MSSKEAELVWERQEDQHINMGASMIAILFFSIAATTSLLVLHVYGVKTSSSLHPNHQMQMQMQNHSMPPPSSSSVIHVYHVTAYGADPTGLIDSTDAILRALSDALNGTTTARRKAGFLYEGIVNLGGVRLDLDGGNYFISRPLLFPFSARANLLIHGGSLTASNDFPNDGYLIDLSPSSTNSSTAGEYNYELVTLRDLYLNSNYRGGGVQVVNSLRTTIDNCYLTHFNTTGISVKGGHETSIRYSYLGQKITAGGDPAERSFSATAIVLAGNDNIVSDTVIFSAATGILISGQANLISGVHCYNKATGFGGVGIYLQLPGLTQTRIINSYMDYTGIVAEDPVQLTIANTFFLGDAFVLFKSVKGIMSGVNVVDNMFAGSDKGVEIVQMQGPFTQVDQVVVDNNSVRGMRSKATVARAAVEGKGTTWTADFKTALLFPNLIKQVHYTFITDAPTVPAHFLKSVSDNKVVIQSNLSVPARLHITAHQGLQA